MKKVLALILAIMLLLSVVLFATACTETTTDPDDKQEEENGNKIPSLPFDEDDGINDLPPIDVDDLPID